MVTPLLDKPALDRVAAAVAQAERGTTAEIVCVVTREVSGYRETPLVAGILAALVLAPAVAVLGLPFAAPLLDTGWRIGHVAAAAAPWRQTVLAYALLQAILFALCAWLAAIPAVRRGLTSDGLKRARVRKAALHQFHSAHFAGAGGRPGVLIFVSTHDRKAEIIAGAAAHAAVGETVWREAIAAIQRGMGAGQPDEGLAGAVEICGAALARHFPAAGPRRNSHPDRPIEV